MEHWVTTLLFFCGILFQSVYIFFFFLTLWKSEGTQPPSLEPVEKDPDSLVIRVVSFSEHPGCSCPLAQTLELKRSRPTLFAFDNVWLWRRKTWGEVAVRHTGGTGSDTTTEFQRSLLCFPDCFRSRTPKQLEHLVTPPPLLILLHHLTFAKDFSDIFSFDFSWKL